MRKLLFAFLLIPAFSFGQDSLLYNIFPTKDGKVFYEKVIEVKASKEDLYKRAKEWALKNFNSQKDASQIDDKESGMIAYRTFFSNSFNGLVEWQYWEVISIYTKDGKAKITVTDIEVKTPAYGSSEAVENILPNYEKAAAKSHYLLKKSAQVKQNTLDNFKTAHLKIDDLIASIEVALKTSNDF